MNEITVVLAPEAARTRILALRGDEEILRSALPDAWRSDALALPTMLRGLAMWTQQRLSVVLVADEEAASSCSDTYEALADASLYYSLGVAVRTHRRRRRSVAKNDARVSFRDLRNFRRFE